MPILDIQRRVHEVGRIRLGEQAEDHPRALGTFRFTSPRRDLLVTAAELFGGTVRPWNNQHEVITEANTLEVLVPPEDVSFSQWWETWSAGGCTRRCDGVREVIHDEPCVCVVDGVRRCDPITRLSVILPAFATFGVWRLETGSWYAAGELQSAVQLALQLADRTGSLASAVLRVERRAVKRPNEPVRRFVVPVLDVQLSAVHGATRAPEMAQTANGGQMMGPESLTTAGLAPPAPKLDRGAPSPAPTATMLEHDNDTPPTLPTPPADSQLTADTEDATVLAFAPATEPPAINAELDKLRRACFAQVRDVMQLDGLFGIEAETLRYALAVLETAKRRDVLVTSWNELTREELSGVSTRLSELKRGQLKVAPDASGTGGVVFTTMTGRTAHVFVDDNGTWQWQLAEPK